RRHLGADEILRPVMLGDLRAGALDAYGGAEVDLELPRGLARLGEGQRLHHRAAAYVDGEELVELDRVGGRRGGIGELVHGRCVAPGRGRGKSSLSKTGRGV